MPKTDGDMLFILIDALLVVNRSNILNTLSALNLFVAWIKVFKYLNFNATMRQLSETLTSVSTTIFASLFDRNYTKVYTFRPAAISQVSR